MDRESPARIESAAPGAAAAAAGGVTIVKRLEGIPHDEFPLPVNDDYERIDQRNQINTYVNSKALTEKLVSNLEANRCPPIAIAVPEAP